MKDEAEKVITITANSADDLMTIGITDTGIGLDGQDIDQLREPFHTTAASGEGMGLGLAISDAIVREHGGQIVAHDTGQGACFEVILPLGGKP